MRGVKGLRVVYLIRPNLASSGMGWWWILYSGTNGLAISNKTYCHLKDAKRNFRRVVQVLSQNFGSPPVKEVIIK